MTSDATDPAIRRYHEKWGFGMAPVKPETLSRRKAAAARVAKSLSEEALEPRGRLEELSADLSDVKGLFTRSYKQDQWDWFTTWAALGRPGRLAAGRAAEALSAVRTALREGDGEAATRAAEAFEHAGGRRALAAYTSDDPIPAPSDVGYVYILSTREQPDMLKIGYTDRSVEKRVAEINQATGVAVPYGARSVWQVRSARQVEAEVHALLQEYRVRPDREFFQVEWRVACGVINRYLRERRSEL